MPEPIVHVNTRVGTNSLRSLSCYIVLMTFIGKEEVSFSNYLTSTVLTQIQRLDCKWLVSFILVVNA